MFMAEQVLSKGIPPTEVEFLEGESPAACFQRVASFYKVSKKQIERQRISYAIPLSEI